MNVYLDIDGVLLINESNVAPYADEFLQTVLAKYPNNTHWLTTHCWKGENRAVDKLSAYLAPKTVVLIKTIKPTEWDEWKTDAIDFSQPFLWFDDDLYPEERAELIKHDVLDNRIEVDLNKDPNQLQKFITSMPLPV